MDTNIDETIVDSTKPNAGRVYEYFLGGENYFEVDRQMAMNIEKIAPFTPKMAKLLRWFLGEAIRRISEKGYTQFIDFASGLPTVGHIHANAKPNSKIVYSDIDPVTVQSGKKLVKDNPTIEYEYCNAATPEILLNSEIVKSLIDKNKKIAIGLNGICYFLSDEQISHAITEIYKWAKEGTIIYIADYDSANVTKEFQAVLDLYNNQMQSVFLRSRNHFIELVKPWKVMDPGFLLFEEWLDLSPATSNETIQTFGGGGFYGGLLVK